MTVFVDEATLLREAVDEDVPTCTYPGCERPKHRSAGGGMCNSHYRAVAARGEEWPVPRQRERRPAVPFPMTPHSVARFMSKIRHDGDCWTWIATVNQSGYGMFRADKLRTAHRVAYLHFIGPIPEGKHLDHLCRNRACVNPAHLEAVTPRTNWERGQGPARINASRTHCVNGHPFDQENTRQEARGGRACRACETRSVACADCGKTMRRGNIARHRKTMHGGAA